MCFFYPNTTLIVSKDRVAKPIKAQWFLCLNLKDCVKQPVAGNRNNSNGTLNNVGSNGNYWSSSVSGTNARNLHFNSSNANMNSNNRANGFSVRCIKEKSLLCS